jgi:hypothetical protein
MDRFGVGTVPDPTRLNYVRKRSQKLTSQRHPAASCFNDAHVAGLREIRRIGKYTTVKVGVNLWDKAKS